MSAAADMTGDASAGRTFRSIFGDQPPGPEHSAQMQPQGPAPATPSADGDAADVGVSVTAAAAEPPAADASMDEDEDEGMWSDDAAAAPTDVSAGLTSRLSGGEGLQLARKSMEEWAEEDDEEDNWKDALQARVNQLELVFQSNNDAAAADSRRRFEAQQQQQPQQPQQPQQSPPRAQQLQRVDFSRSLPASTRFTAADAPATSSQRERPASRHKMQRTSSSHACISGESAVPLLATSRHHARDYQHKPSSAAAPSKEPPPPQRQRPRATSTDFVARNIQAVDHSRKRSGSLSSTSSRTDSPRHARGSRKNSLDGSSHASAPAPATASASASASANGRRRSSNSSSSLRSAATRPTAVFNLSDTEAIRRFVLDDVKQMSMERLVNDAQRLHFLEQLYQHEHQRERENAPRLAPSATSSTAVAPPQSPSSAMSLS